MSEEQRILQFVNALSLEEKLAYIQHVLTVENGAHLSSSLKQHRQSYTAATTKKKKRKSNPRLSLGSSPRVSRSEPFTAPVHDHEDDDDTVGAVTSGRRRTRISWASR